MRYWALLFSIVTGCAGAGAPAVGRGESVTPAPTVASTAQQPTALCVFDGPWTGGGLRLAGSGIRFARLSVAHAHAALVDRDADVMLDVRADAGGWHLVGVADPERDGTLRVRKITWLSDILALSPGTSARVVAASSGRARIMRPRFAFSDGDGFSFADPAGRWVSCDALSLTYTYRNAGTRARERIALGLPEKLPERVIAKTATAAISAQPGGRPILHIGPRDVSITAAVIEEREENTRVVIQHWSGAAIVGWVASSVLSTETEGAGGLMGVLGNGERSPQVLCTVREKLALFVAPGEGPSEEAGWLDPGTVFVRTRARADGWLEIQPTAPWHVMAEHATAWTVHPKTALDCHEG